MATKLMTQECSENCKEQCEFKFNIKILKLILCDNEKDRGFEDIILALTLDSNVIRIDNIQSQDENINVEREVTYQTTPEKFTKKLKKSPIFFNLVRECTDLGTIKLQIADCFTDAVLCDEFSSEKMTCDYTFNKDGKDNATMEISIRVSRSFVDNEAMKDFLRTNAKRKEKNKQQKIFGRSESIDSNDGLSVFMCDADLYRELCPTDDKTVYTASSKSKQSGTSKCLSDIAASLDVNIFSNNQKTFCQGCRGYSISGITCINKKLLSKSDSSENVIDDFKMVNISKIPQKHPQTLNRICSECFADLKILPKNKPCPNCCRLNKPSKIGQNKIGKKPCLDALNSSCKNISNEVVPENKNNMHKKKYLQKTDTLTICKTKQKKGFKTKQKCEMFPRCSKIQKANRNSKVHNRKGLRIKHYGIVLGHKDCKYEPLLVPKNMGWLWNVNNPGITKNRRGWKPGAILKSVAKMMKCFLVNKKEEETLACHESSHLVKSTPTLKVEKRLSDYKIILNPISDKPWKMEAPIIFKISKTEDEKKRSDAIKLLKSRAINKTCECNDISVCSCIDDCRKQIILYELKDLSDMLCISPELKYEELNEASECSEIDFEFTPPIDMMNKCKRDDVRVSVAATQYEEQPLEEFEKTEQSIENNIEVAKKKRKSNEKKKNVNKNAKNLRKSSKLGIIEKPHQKDVCYSRPMFKSEITCDSTTNNFHSCSRNNVTYMPPFHNNCPFSVYNQPWCNMNFNAFNC